MRITVSQLGLAAFIKMKGAELIRVDGKLFIFESAKSVAEWRVNYSNSCCRQHDSLVCYLRRFLQEV